MNTPPTTQELWEELVLEAGEDEIEAAAAVTVADAEAYLTAHGFDVAAERAKGEAFLDDLAGRPVAVQASERVSELPPERRADSRADRRTGRRRSLPSPVWIAAAATVAAGGAAAAAYVALHDEPVHDRAPPVPSVPVSVPSVPPPVPPPDIALAATLRQRAAAALDQHKPQEALQLLDEARDKDPEGDLTTEGMKLRERALNAMPPMKR